MLIINIEMLESSERFKNKQTTKKNRQMSCVREGGTRDGQRRGRRRDGIQPQCRKAAGRGKGRGEWGESGGGGTFEMTLPFFEDTAVISNVNWRLFFL